MPSGVFDVPRDPKLDARARRAMQRLAGAKEELILHPSITTDDLKRLKVNTAVSENVISTQVFGP